MAHWLVHWLCAPTQPLCLACELAPNASHLPFTSSAPEWAWLERLPLCRALSVNTCVDPWDVNTSTWLCLQRALRPPRCILGHFRDNMAETTRVVLGTFALVFCVSSALGKTPCLVMLYSDIQEDILVVFA